MPDHKIFAPDIFHVTIEALTTEGQGIARIPVTADDDTRGFTVFCEGLLPGEEAEIRVTSYKKKYALAECVRLIRTSPDRIAPYCPVYKPCGGCTLQHLKYEEQLHVKREHVVSCMTRIGRQPAARMESLTRPTIGMEIPYDYRNHTEYPVGETVKAEPAADEASPSAEAAPPAISLSRDLKIGLYGKKSHTIVPHDACRLAHPACETVRRVTEQFCLIQGITGYDEATGLGLLRHLIVRVGRKTGEVMVILVVNRSPDAELEYPTEAYAAEITRHLEKDRETQILQHAANAGTSESFPLFLLDTPWTLKSIWLNYNTTGARQGQIVSYRKENQRLLWGARQITDQIGENQYDISPLSFFQVNPLQTKKLYDTVRSYALGQTASAAESPCTNPEEKWPVDYDESGKMTPAVTCPEPASAQAKIPVLVDLYCGAGTIGLHLAHQTEKIVGIESNESAVLDAIQNAAKNGVAHASYRTAHAEKLSLSDFPEDTSCVILDPPRKGCDPALLTTLLSLYPPRIVYVSCDPATLARDISLLTAGGYEIKAIQPVDMFPWTGHVETVVLISQEDN